MNNKKKQWTAVGAASVLGLGIIAGGAAVTANAMPLNDIRGGEDAGVRPLQATVTDDLLPQSATDPGSLSLDSTSSTSSDEFVQPTWSPVSPQSPNSPQSTDSPQTPNTAASPMSSPSPVSPASPISVQSPASID